MRTYQITAKQLVLLALVTVVFAASAVLFYDRFGPSLLGRLAGAKTEKVNLESAPVAGLTDPSVASDEKNNQEVYAAISPGVVNITTTSVVRDWFSAYQAQGSGSGSILDKEGRILTNYHVVQGSDQPGGSLEVALANGNHYPAKLLGADPDNDLAVIKIDAPKESLTVVPLGSANNLFVGQKVLAMGNPFGFDRTLTTGIVSGLGRQLRSEMTNRLIENVVQTDAAINPGNSGGPLLNSRGQMIGINTMIYSPSGGSVGIGFAVPVETAKRVISDILQYGRVRKPRLGIDTVPLSRFSQRLIQALELPVSEGLMVLRVAPGSAAARAGLQNAEEVQLGRYTTAPLGDVIVSVDGQKIASSDDLDRVLKDKNIGDRVPMEIVRNGRRQALTVQLAELPNSDR
ncbi:MAG: trypsin-like peptidase domain-containing protein [Acidobacteria bacterium]|nr:trypsin-like peptidase domain-containing protein [Acidobacteriota bacterium]